MLLAIAVVAAAYPWMTGAYTVLQQQRMRFAFDSPKPAAEPAKERSRLFESPEMVGWESEDAAYWKSLADGEEFARIVIPSIDVDIMVVKGVAKRDLKRGPGWLSETALPGEMGNTGMSGHRTTFLAPFRRLDKVELGSMIQVQSPFRVYTYRVARKWTVLPKEGHVMAPTDEPSLTITTCHPPFSDRKRLVIRATLERVQRIEDGPSDQGK